MNRGKYIKNAVLWAVTIAYLMLSSVTVAQQTYSFGIVPQQSGTKMSRLWTPILLYLEGETDLKLEFATARNIPTFEKRLLDGKYDFAYMNPYHYTFFHEKAGYQAFAKAKKKRLKGIIVVLKDSPYKNLEDLNEQELAFPSNAFAANQIPRAIFGNMDLAFDSHYVSSHDSVYRNVAKGRYAAGGGVMRTFNNTAAKYRDKLRILWVSDGYTPHAFAVHPRVPQDVVDKLQQAMLNMDSDPTGKLLLKSVRLKGIERGRNEEWDDVRALNL